VVLGVSEIVNHPDLHVCAVKKQTGAFAINMLNKAQQPVSFNLQLGDWFATVHLPANCVETIEVALPE